MSLANKFMKYFLLLISICGISSYAESNYKVTTDEGITTTSKFEFATTTRIPDRIIAEWGTINNDSLLINPRNYYSFYTTPGTKLEWDIRVTSWRLIDGIRLTSIDNTIESGEIIEGGIGHYYLVMKVIAFGNYLNCLIEKFDNFTYYTTPIFSSTPFPEEIHLEVGNTDINTKLDEKRFQKYSSIGISVSENETLSTSGTILGIKLTKLSNTVSSWSLIGGGLNESNVTFNFRGIGSYDYKLEIFGNSAITLKFNAIFVVVLLNILIFFMK